jgi:hypothetical protein
MRQLKNVYIYNHVALTSSEGIHMGFIARPSCGTKREYFEDHGAAYK